LHGADQFGGYFQSSSAIRWTIIRRTKYDDAS
jgi:hypothetical protein